MMMFTKKKQVMRNLRKSLKIEIVRVMAKREDKFIYKKRKLMILEHDVKKKLAIPSTSSRNNFFEQEEK